MSWNPNRKNLTTTQKNRIRNKLRHTCNQCGRPAHQIDHKTPLSQGGTNHPNNLQLLCNTCHQHKTTQEQRQGRLTNKKHTPNPTKHPKEPHPGIKHTTPGDPPPHPTQAPQQGDRR